ncbi:MAG TPA: hypothetical protein VNQ76_14135 [Planctomicrobium sp.]|nr:hypothetical protein [Planctomicrobium sp.]
MGRRFPACHKGDAMPGLTPRAGRKTARTVRQYARQKRNLVGVRRQIYPTSRGGGSCSEVDLLSTTGAVSGGSVVLTYVINEETEDVEINWDSTEEAAQEAYEEHPGIGVGNVKVVGGPWPAVALHVIFKGDLSGKTIDFPAVQDNLTGGGALRMWKASSANWKGYDE